MVRKSPILSCPIRTDNSQQPLLGRTVPITVIPQLRQTPLALIGLGTYNR